MSSNTAWYAIYTKPRQEERAATNLHAWGIEIVLPRIAQTDGGRTVRPFFPRYLFAKFHAADMLHKVNQTRGVSRVVSFGASPIVVDSEVVDAIRDHADRNLIVRRRDKFSHGDLVRLSNGPLQEMIGILESHGPETDRVRILLTCVSYSLRVQANVFDIRKADKTASA